MCIGKSPRLLAMALAPRSPFIPTSSQTVTENLQSKRPFSSHLAHGWAWLEVAPCPYYVIARALNEELKSGMQTQ